MTIDELYSFCKKNNFSKFDSKEFGKELIVDMPGNFSKSENSSDRLTEGLTPFVSRAFHDKININNSEIKEEDFKENVPSSHLRPVLANLTKDEETGELDFGSHDTHVEKIIEKDENGNEVTVEKVVYDEQPIGVIDGSKTTIEYDEDAKVNRAVLHGYLYNEYCQDAIDILERRGTVDCSVELSIREMSMNAKEGTLVLNDFYVSGLTLLSAKIKPGMKGSNFKIEDFSADTISTNFSKDEKIIELLEKINNALSKFNENNSTKGGSDKSMNKFEELLAKYNKTVDDITFDYENLSDEELEAKFEEEFGKDSKSNKDEEDAPKEDNACGGGGSGSGSGSKKKSKNSSKKSEKDGTTVECSYIVNGESKKFAVSLQEKIYAIQDLVNATYAESDNTYYGVSVYEDYVIMCDYWSGRYYKQSYTSENDNYSLTGERVEVYAEFVTSDEQKELNDMRSNYSSIEQELKQYKKSEEDAKKEKLLNSEEYSAVKDVKEFTELKEKAETLSFEELQKQCDKVLLDFVKSNGKFSFSEKETKKEQQSFIFGKKEETNFLDSLLKR